MPSSGQPESSDIQPATDSATANLSSEILTTNYGSQVTYNYGSISNYFCHDPSSHHQHNAPAITPQKSSKTQWSDKIEEAQRLYASSCWKEAKALFYEVLFTRDVVPELSDTILIKYNLAHAHFALTEYREAANYFKGVADIYAENPTVSDTGVDDSLYWLARTFYHRNQFVEAASHLKKFIQAKYEYDLRSTQQAITGRLWLGLTFDRLMQYDRAQNQLEMAYDMRLRVSGLRDLETLACRHHLANFLFKRNKVLKACDHFDEILTAEELLVGPEKSQAIKTRFMLAWCLAKLGRLDEADPHFQRVYARFSVYHSLTREEGKDFGLVCYWLGRITLRRPQLRNHELCDAQNMLQRALNLLAEEDDLEKEFIDCRLHLAKIMTRKGHAAGAEQILRNIIEVSNKSNDNSIEGHLGLADALMHQKKFKEAKSCLETVIDIGKPLPEIPSTEDQFVVGFHILGQAYAKLLQFSMAKICYQRVIASCSSSSSLRGAQAHFDLAMVFFEVREFEYARAHFQQAQDRQSKVQPGSETISQIWLTWTLCELGSFEDAESSIKTSLAFLPGISEEPSPESDSMIGRNDYYRACISLYRKNPRQAATMCRSALPRLQRLGTSAYPLYVQCLYQHARALVLLREMDEAQAKLQELTRSQSEDGQINRICNVLAPFWLGYVNFYRSKDDVAEPLLRQCLGALVTGFSLKNVGFARHDVHYYHAFCLCYMQRHEESIEKLQNMLDLPVIEQEFLGYIRHRCRKLLGLNFFFLDQATEACKQLELFFEELKGKEPRYSDTELSQDSAILASCLCETQRFDEAQVLLAGAAAMTNTTPGSFRSVLKGLAMCWQGRIAFDKGSTPRAKDLIEKAQSMITMKHRSRHKMIDRTFYVCQFFLARVQIREKNYATAESLLRKLSVEQTSAGFFAEAVDSQFWLGHSLQAHGDYRSATPVFQKIIESKVDARILTQTMATCLSRLSEGFYNCKNFDEAKSHAELSITHSDGQTLVHQTHYFLGLTNYRLGLFEEAKGGFITTMEKDRSKTRLLSCRYWLGMSNFKVSDFENAVLYLQLALDSAEEAWRHRQLCQFSLARALFEMARYDIAKGHFAALSSANSNARNSELEMILESQGYLGRCSLEQGRFTEAKETLSSLVTRLEQSRPRDGFALNSARFYIALCHRPLGNHEQAKIELKNLVPYFEAQPIDESHIRFRLYCELGHVTYSQRRYIEALGWYQKTLQGIDAIENDKKFDIPDCLNRIGKCLFFLRRWGEATQALRTALESYQNRSDESSRALIDTQSYLSRTLCNAGFFGAALPHAVESFKMQEQLTSSDHCKLGMRLLVLGNIAFGFSHHERAEKIFSEALHCIESSSEKRTQQDARLVARAYAERAMIFSVSGNTEEAQMMAEKAVQTSPTTTIFTTGQIPGFIELFPAVIACKATATRSDAQETVSNPQDSSTKKLNESKVSKKQAAKAQSAAAAAATKTTKKKKSRLTPADPNTSTGVEQPSVAKTINSPPKTTVAPSPLTFPASPTPSTSPPFTIQLSPSASLSTVSPSGPVTMKRAPP